MEKEQKQELGWRVSVLPIPAFHHCEPLCVACTQCTVECRIGQEWVIQIPSIPILVSVLFPSLHLKYFRIKFLLLDFGALERFLFLLEIATKSTTSAHAKAFMLEVQFPTTRGNRGDRECTGLKEPVNMYNSCQKGLQLNPPYPP